jgi:hypothetical protein
MLWEQNNILREQDNMLWEQNNKLWELICIMYQCYNRKLVITINRTYSIEMTYMNIYMKHLKI